MIQQPRSAVPVVSTSLMHRIALVATVTLFTLTSFAAKPVVKPELMNGQKLKPSALAQLPAIRAIKETRTPA